ncbi:DUF6485 family protein [Desulfosporosinus sp. FKB]|uniref:DUF6485 family protein n=1 Tax=Desulfosporosinus sp. FKB TaxID=1969835 RepID=UPI000B49C6B1|nr:DUF6485 family protein [Desulfosporosinus sp. FKB]
MRTKEEYYELVLNNRKIASDPLNLKCTCTEVLCEWHGRCRECVALHRYHQDHVPACFQAFINDKLKDIVKIGEMTAERNKKTPTEYRLYVKEQDQLLRSRPES